MLVSASASSSVLPELPDSKAVKVLHAVSSPVDKTIVGLAKAAVRQVNEEIRSLPRCFGPFHEFPEDMNVSAMELTYGVEKSLEYLFVTSVLKENRIVVESMVGSRNDQISIFIRTLIASKCRVGACGELSIATMEKIIEHSPLAHITVSSRKKSNDNHAFLIVFDTKKQEEYIQSLFQRCISYYDFLRQLPQEATVVDPFFNRVVLVSDLETEGKQLMTYAKSSQFFTTAEKITVFEKGSKEFSLRVQEPAKQIYSRMLAEKSIIEGISNRPSSKILYQVFEGIKGRFLSSLKIISISAGNIEWKLSPTKLLAFCLLDIGQEKSVLASLDGYKIPYDKSLTKATPSKPQQICIQVTRLNSVQEKISDFLRIGLEKGWG